MVQSVNTESRHFSGVIGLRLGLNAAEELAPNFTPPPPEKIFATASRICFAPAGKMTAAR